MRNISMIIEYDGTRYSGWQRQNNTKNTIQNKLESILNILFENDLKDGKSLEIHASGRTDTGVHARGQVVNFWIESNIDNNEIKEYVNVYLPEDIRILIVEDKAPRFHSRLNVKSKTYEYNIDNFSKPDVFNRKYTWNVEGELNIEKIIEGSKLLIGVHDFTSFTDNRSSKKSNIREIFDINIRKTKSGIIITYVGNGFLYHMARIITAYLVKIGKDEITIDDIKTVLAAKKRDKTVQLAPARGLILDNVKY